MTTSYTSYILLRHLSKTLLYSLIIHFYFYFFMRIMDKGEFYTCTWIIQWHFISHFLPYNLKFEFPGLICAFQHWDFTINDCHKLGKHSYSFFLTYLTQYFMDLTHSKAILRVFCRHFSYEIIFHCKCLDHGICSSLNGCSWTYHKLQHSILWHMLSPTLKSLFYKGKCCQIFSRKFRTLKTIEKPTRTLSHFQPLLKVNKPSHFLFTK